MSEIGELWREERQRSQVKRADNRKASADILRNRDRGGGGMIRRFDINWSNQELDYRESGAFCHAQDVLTITAIMAENEQLKADIQSIVRKHLELLQWAARQLPIQHIDQEQWQAIEKLTK